MFKIIEKINDIHKNLAIYKNDIKTIGIVLNDLFAEVADIKELIGKIKGSKNK